MFKRRNRQQTFTSKRYENYEEITDNQQVRGVKECAKEENIWFLHLPSLYTLYLKYLEGISRVRTVSFALFVVSSSLSFSLDIYLRAMYHELHILHVYNAYIYVYSYSDENP